MSGDHADRSGSGATGKQVCKTMRRLKTNPSVNDPFQHIDKLGYSRLEKVAAGVTHDSELASS